MPNKDIKHKYSLRARNKQRGQDSNTRDKRQGNISDSSDEDYSSNEENEDEFNLKEYRNLLSELFPSKFMEQRAA